MMFLYSLAIHIYGLGIWLASWFNPKAKLWIEGRKKNAAFYKLLSEASGKKIWMHCASLGEFEQGRPVIENLRKDYPDAFILLTFFSPSGYEIRKDFAGVSHVAYLPEDTIRNAKLFVAAFNPDISIFVKYEFWFNYLAELKKQNCPVIFISAIFRKEQWFFKSFARQFLKIISEISHFFVQDDLSKEILNFHGITNVNIAGDTRFDRVIELSKYPKNLALIEGSNRRMIVAGSTWEKDEMLLKKISDNISENILYIIVPHDIATDRISNCLRICPQPAYKLSSITDTEIQIASSVIVDQIGLLSSLYQYADICYVGGGFGKGIHNTLEAAVYGKAVVFGPNFHKFREAKGLINAGGGFGIKNASEASIIFKDLLDDEGYRLSTGKNSKEYVNANSGATLQILDKLKQYL